MHDENQHLGQQAIRTVGMFVSSTEQQHSTYDRSVCGSCQQHATSRTLQLDPWTIRALFMNIWQHPALAMLPFEGEPA